MFKLNPVSSGELIDQQSNPDWLIRDVLLDGSAAVILGPSKCLKTSIAFDLALSLGTGTAFLNRFPVAKLTRTLVILGNTPPCIIRDTSRQIAKSKGVTDYPDVLCVYDDLPYLDQPEHLTVLRDAIIRQDVRCCIIDPLFLVLQPMIDLDETMQALADVGTETGCTMIVVHHARQRRRGKRFVPLSRADVITAGVDDFATQRMLISRRSVFNPGEPHRLSIQFGGAPTPRDSWALDIDDGTGRGEHCWDVRLRTLPADVE